MGVRWYSPRIGRWISADSIIPDPANPQSLNRYAYVYNRPVNLIDPSGHFPEFDFGTGGGRGEPPPPPDQPLVMSFLNPGDTARRIWRDLNPWGKPIVDAPRAPKPTSSDMTGWLVEQMRTNAQAPVTQAIQEHWRSRSFSHMVAAYQAWVALVRGGAVWDFKVDIPKDYKESGVTLGGYQMDFDAVANIHFGFVGKEAGFVGGILSGGAGLAQWRQWKDVNPSQVGPWHTYLDDPFDNWCVEFGIYLHDLYGADPSKLTEETFNEALGDYTGTYGLPSRGVYPKEP